jgi:hypothetical protein
MEAMNNKQQTAVEWYAGRQHDLEGLRDVGAISPIEYYEQLTQALQQAKEMEKEQTEQAKLDAKEIIIIKHTEHGGNEQ